MVVEVILAEVGETRDCESHSVDAALLEGVARHLDGYGFHTRLSHDPDYRVKMGCFRRGATRHELRVVNSDPDRPDDPRHATGGTQAGLEHVGDGRLAVRSGYSDERHRVGRAAVDGGRDHPEEGSWRCDLDHRDEAAHLLGQHAHSLAIRENGDSTTGDGLTAENRSVHDVAGHRGEQVARPDEPGIELDSGHWSSFASMDQHARISDDRNDLVETHLAPFRPRRLLHAATAWFRRREEDSAAWCRWVECAVPATHMS